ncbi:hypothetical protein AGLY_015822 [Aphis glycines]|uniref:MULE transposase domain-containing protein n=1 Tax=Aphis glycines TaxID=307491 RepID=A0A6G0SZS8_APHGL|nr:hypothetical protein AGLY_015822 [Aphis glycines]
MNDISNFRRHIYRQRRKSQPVLPKSIEEAVQQLAVRQTEIQTFKLERFVFVHEDNSIVAITCKTNLQYLCTSLPLYADGTFNYCRKYFYQMYTIHAYKNNMYLPLVYFLLNGKSTECYIKMWYFLNELCGSFNLSFKPDLIRTDFEISAHIAIKINAKYSVVNFILANLVSDAFYELIEISPSENAFEFSDYVLKNYIEENCLFPPEIWAEAPSTIPKTTNGPESFHRHYNEQFYSAHPSLWKVIEVLKEIQVETNIKMNEESTRLRTKEIKNIEFVNEHYFKYTSGEINRQQFLSIMGHSGANYNFIKVNNPYLTIAMRKRPTKKMYA